MRKGLIALIFNIWLDLMAEKGCAPTAEEMADHLISNGVTIRKYGQWEQCFEDWRQQIEGDKCSACGFEHYGCNINHYHYCPNCGAKMEKEAIT